MPITAVYASLLALLFVALCARVIKLRRRFQVALGDGGEPELLRAIRAQGNFAEYVPLALLLIALAESAGAAGLWVHLLGLLLLLGRGLHAWGVSAVREDLRLRIVGMLATFVALVGGAVTNLLLAATG